MSKKFSTTLIFLVTLAASSPTLAASGPVFVPMGGFSLLNPDYPPPPGGPIPYDHTVGKLQWSVGPWGSPGGRMPAFNRLASGIDFDTAVSAVGVHVTTAADGTILNLQQNGAPLPCKKNNSPLEFDLFAEPNGMNVKPPRKNGYDPAVLKTPLSNFVALQLSAEITMRESLASTRKHCLANFANTQFSVILLNRNVQPNQVLFYQLLFSRLCGHAKDIKLNACSTPHDQISFFTNRPPYGANDFLPAVGLPWLQNGIPRRVDVNLLPRLKLAISLGPTQMDHNPAHWQLGSIYLGQSIYGDTTLSSRWSNVSLTAHTR